MEMTQLHEFMLLFRFDLSASAPQPEVEAEMHKQWGSFIGKLAMSGALVGTHQLGDSGKILNGTATLDGVHSAENTVLGGTLLLKAPTIEAAAELAKDCPILAMGGTVEVRDVIPVIL